MLFSEVKIQWCAIEFLHLPIEMRSLWTEVRYIKSAARVLNRDFVNKSGLDLSKEVL